MNTISSVIPSDRGAIKRTAHRFIVCTIIPGFLLLAGCKESGVPKADSPVATTPDADNSAKNARDRDNATLTPGDQGNSPTDRDITQKIRKALVIDASGYSLTAKNIKIITIDGKVTLRGPVKTEAEKMGIVAIARTMAGEGNVDDQLEVKANP